MCRALLSNPPYEYQSRARYTTLLFTSDTPRTLGLLRWDIHGILWVSRFIKKWHCFLMNRVGRGRVRSAVGMFEEHFFALQHSTSKTRPNVHPHWETPSYFPTIGGSTCSPMQRFTDDPVTCECMSHAQGHTMACVKKFLERSVCLYFALKTSPIVVIIKN